MRRILKFLAFFSLSITLLSSSVQSFAQVMEPDLASHVEIHLTDETLLGVLSSLSVEHRVPLGLERGKLDTNQRKFNIESKDKTLKEILDLIVQQEPTYRWEVISGVINFVPVSSRDEFFEQLLNIRVSRFSPAKGTTIFEVRNAIADLPEVHHYLVANHKSVFRYGDYIYRPSVYSNLDADLSISDTDVRGILNRIVKTSEHKLWILEWQNHEKGSLAIRF
jgi:hypothetical protein